MFVKMCYCMHTYLAYKSSGASKHYCLLWARYISNVEVWVAIVFDILTRSLLFLACRSPEISSVEFANHRQAF